MEQQVRYVNTTDGVSIAHWSFGNGDPLVYMVGGPWGHIDLWDLPECREWYDRLATTSTIFRYDVRGTGLSQRDTTDFSLEARLSDLEAVAARVEASRFTLFAAADAGPVAIAYAVRHPERVSRLILWCSWAKHADTDTPRLQAWRSLIDQDWDLMTDTCVQLALGWQGSDVGKRAADHLRESVTTEVMRASMEAANDVDVTALIPQVKAPTLVIQRKGIPWLPVSIGRDMASHMQNARLVLLDGEATAPYLGDSDIAANAIEEFLATGSKGIELPPKAEVRPDKEDVSATPVNIPDGLTRREVEVLQLLAGGNTNNEVAESLVLSVRTVERHIGNIYGKINARGRADATAYALTRGIV